MKRTDRQKLVIRRETLRRLASGELALVAGGKLGCCTYLQTGCRFPETEECVPTEDCGEDNTCTNPGG